MFLHSALASKEDSFPMRSLRNDFNLATPGEFNEGKFPKFCDFRIELEKQPKNVNPAALMPFFSVHAKKENDDIPLVHP